jgi:transposase
VEEEKAEAAAAAAAEEEELAEEEDSIKRLLKRCGIPYTRENYIAYNWPDPVEEWTAEDEMFLPADLQLAPTPDDDDTE